MKRVRSKAIIKQEAFKERIILFIFVYLIFASLYFSVNTLAKYTGTVSGTGETQVAKWEVSATPNSNSPMNIIAGNDTDSYKITVTSTSEVGCSYSISLSNVPTGVIVKLDDKDPVTVGADKKVTFTNCGEFSANTQGQQRIHTLELKAGIDITPVSNNEMNVDVSFVQKQV